MMRVLYLDTMDIGNACDGKYGPEALDELSSCLQPDEALAFSSFHLLEMFGASETSFRERLGKLFAANIPLVTFGADPRDLELLWLYHSIQGTTAPPAQPFLPIVADQLDELSKAGRRFQTEALKANRGFAKADFFSSLGESHGRTTPIRLALLPVRNDLPNRLATLAQLEKVDLVAHIPDALQKRYQRVHETSVADEILAIKPQMKKRAFDRRALAKLRTLLKTYAIDIEGDDKDITWDDAVARMMITERARALLKWTPPAKWFPGLVVNRIQYTLEAARRQDAQRVCEPGDFVDALHAVYLPLVNVMTCDKRTATLLEATKIPALAAWVKARVRRGGNRERYLEAIELFNQSRIVS